ncbi:hypothetical protein [Rhodanobacter sp. C05]|uniref:hypothetical protein n=1 Tax=Rhodanobacter sp. C05 TaxID=1945855 RepID=UPI001179FAE6|nr:hypothetical protein [Rhodanobacter sp. C05]
MSRRRFVAAWATRTVRDAIHPAGTRHFILKAPAMAVSACLHSGFLPSGPLLVSDTDLVVQPMHLDLP